MSLVNYSFTALKDSDPTINAVPAQAVSVKVEFDDSLAVIYEDSAGASPITQPGAVTDGNGVLSFWVEAGIYKIESASRTEIQIIDNGSRLNPDTVADMAASKHLRVGDKPVTKEFSTGNGGGGTYDIVLKGTTAGVDLPNAMDIIVSTASPLIVFVLRKGNSIHVDQLGAKGDYNSVADTGTDNTAVFQFWAALGGTISHEGDKSYKVTDILTPVASTIIKGLGSAVYQRDILKPLWDLNTAGRSEFHGGDYSHNMDILDYNILNGKLFFADVFVDDILLYNVKIFKTAQQGFTIDNTGNNIKLVLCEIEETARDGVFFVDVTKAKVALCNFKNTGDDSIAFARDSFDHICSNNTIEGAGSYNLGGSGIRSNSSGTISGNQIKNSDLFGIIAANNTDETTIRPDGLTIAHNVITGIVQTGVPTAGIGFRSVKTVECMGNQISMNAKEANAYRAYGSDFQNTNISVIGGKAKNCSALCQVRDLGVGTLSIKEVKMLDCVEPLLIDATGALDTIIIESIESNNTTNASILTVGSTNTATIGNIQTKDNRLKSPNSVNFNYNSKVVTSHVSTNDEFATGVFADTLGDSNVTELIIDGRYGDVMLAQGSITFNAANSGLIAINLNKVPLASEISLNLESTLGSASYFFIDFVDSNNFRITLDTAPGTNVTFSWKVDCFKRRKVQ